MCGDGHYLSPALIAGLGLAYGSPPTPEAVFDAILALLSAPGYTRRFPRDLEDSFPHIPFPADPGVFQTAARIGSEIRALQSFSRPPAEAFRRARLLGRASGVTLWVPPSGRAFLATSAGDNSAAGGFIPLQEDQSLRLSGVSEAAFGFQVSGYPVLHRWLKAREGDALDDLLNREMLDMVWRLTEMLHHFEVAEPVLLAALANPLTRGELGLPRPVPFGADPLSSDENEQRESPS